MLLWDGDCYYDGKKTILDISFMSVVQQMADFITMPSFLLPTN